LTSPITLTHIQPHYYPNMSDIHESMIEDLNTELLKSKMEMEAKVKALEEKMRVAQRAEEEKVRKAMEAWQKAEAEEKAEAERQAKAKQEAEKA
jgi:hypothetical protein